MQLAPYAAAKSMGFAFSLLVIELNGLGCMAGVEFDGCNEAGDEGDGECSDESSIEDDVFMTKLLAWLEEAESCSGIVAVEG